ncbi:MAG: hypothetical protein HRU38_01905 [Saccharospirillaceae bacterium]|nr:hypothetical protein [Pseudomonadales bacterium]NRB77413.1 hypothetical protein [Saccharospirillaceae bacterium]
MNKIYRFILFTILMISFMSCGINAQPNISEGTDLIELSFQALKNNDVKLIHPMIMTELRYRQLMEEINESSGEESADELTNDQLKELGLESNETLVVSFQAIVEIMAQLDFDLNKAQLISTMVKKQRTEGERETKWIKYSLEDIRTRLDINYIIESEGNLALIKLNDAFLVDGKRYLARGYRFQSYKPVESNNKRINNLVSALNLNGWIPEIEK